MLPDSIRAGSRGLLVTDVDDTLIGDDVSLALFARYAERRPEFQYVLNSSRPIQSVLRTLNDLPVQLQPAGIIGAMGTEIILDDTLDDDWQRRFESWERTVVDRIMLELGAEAHADEFQTLFKASFSVPPERQPDAIAAIAASGQPSRIVSSGSTDFDVLPPGAGKGAATLRCVELLKCPLEDLVVAGDSGNDVDLFKVSTRGILVGNARQELRSGVDKSTAYESTQPFAAGIIEGLAYWGLFPLESD